MELYTTVVVYIINMQEFGIEWIYQSVGGLYLSTEEEGRIKIKKKGDVDDG